VVDGDGDGDLDLLSASNSGGVYWSENQAGKGKMPELTSFQPVIPPSLGITYGSPLREEDLKGPTSATCVWAADVNGDGKLDLLVGDMVNLVTPAKGLSDEEFKKKAAAWQEEVTAFSKVVASEKSKGETCQSQRKASTTLRKTVVFHDGKAHRIRVAVSAKVSPNYMIVNNQSPA